MVFVWCSLAQLAKLLKTIRWLLVLILAKINISKFSKLVNLVIELSYDALIKSFVHFCCQSTNLCKMCTQILFLGYIFIKQQILQLQFHHVLCENFILSAVCCIALQNLALRYSPLVRYATLLLSSICWRFVFNIVFSNFLNNQFKFSIFKVNYKMQMNFRRMFNDRKHHKRSKRGSNKVITYSMFSLFQLHFLKFYLINSKDRKALLALAAAWASNRIMSPSMISNRTVPRNNSRMVRIEMSRAYAKTLSEHIHTKNHLTNIVD